MNKLNTKNKQTNKKVFLDYYIHTSRGSPLESDLRSPNESNDSAPIDADKLEWLFSGETKERGDGEASFFLDAQDNLLCSRK